MWIKNGNVQNIRISDDPIAAIFAPLCFTGDEALAIHESGKPATKI